MTVAIIEKQLKATNGIHNIDNLATKPHLNKAIIMSSCKLSKREILLMQQQNIISSVILNVRDFNKNRSMKYC